LGGLRLIMILAVVVLVLIGLASIYATGKTSEFNKQLFWVGLSIAGFMFVNTFHYRILGPMSFAIYLLTLILLGFVLVGKYIYPTDLVPEITGRGAYRWIRFGPISLQPSELAKLSYILALAWYLRYRRNFRSLPGLIGPFVLTLLPIGLIILEPDLGTVLLFFPVLFSVLFVAGAKVRHLLTIMAIGLLVSPIFYLALKPYQQDRIKGLIKQNSRDPYWRLGHCFQLNQSKIFVGAGGLTGQGWKKGLYIKYLSLPDKHNDFIFALIAHQWGFFGGLIILALYGLILVGGIEIAASQVDPFGRLLAVGVSALLASQMFINIGMTMGLMPVTGMTLPFISYGGSSLLSSFLALGLLVNVARRQGHQIAPNAFEFDD